MSQGFSQCGCFVLLPSIGLSLGLLVMTTKGLTQSSEGSEGARPRDDVASAKNSWEGGRVCERLGHRATLHLLLKQKQDSNVSTALRANWLVCATRAYPSVVSDTHRALGFIEGRIAMQPPTGWEIMFIMRSLSGRPEQRDRILSEYLSQDPSLTNIEGTYHYAYRKHQPTGFGIVAPPGIRVEKDGAVARVGISEKRICVPEGLLLELCREGGKRLVATVGRERAVVGLYDSLGASFPLVSLEPKTGKILWKSKVWGFGTENLLGVSGHWEHDVTIELTDKLVTVFGIGTGGCYIEAFHLDSGLCFYRFSTNNWFFDKRKDQ